MYKVRRPSETRVRNGKRTQQQTAHRPAPVRRGGNPLLNLIKSGGEADKPADAAADKPADAAADKPRKKK